MTAPTFVLTDADTDPAALLKLPPLMEARIAKCRIYLDGLERVREAKEAFLPLLVDENPERYAVRNKQGALHPAPEQMQDVITGMLLQTEITFEKDMPQEGIDFWEDVDAAGKGGAEYSEEIIRDALGDGIAGTFTDMPSSDSEDIDRSGASAAAVPGAQLDAADGVALGLRPYWVAIAAGDYKETWGKIRGSRVLVQFVFRERLRVHVEPFGEREVIQYRRYRRSAQNVVTRELYREPDGGGRATVVPGSLVTLQNCTEIKWSPLKFGNLLRDKVSRKPPLESLIDQAIMHYQIMNGMMNVSFEAFVSTIVRVGSMPIKTETLDDGTVKLTFAPLRRGAGETIEMPPLGSGEPPQERIFYLQPDSDVIIPANTMLDRVETMINIISGAFFGLDTLGVESGVAKKEKNRGGNAVITKFARAYKQMLELSYRHVLDFLGLKAGGIHVKLQFNEVELQASDLLAIGALVDRGMAIEDAVDVLIAKGFFGPHPERDQIIQRWEDNESAKQLMQQDQQNFDNELAAATMQSKTSQKPAAKKSAKKTPKKASDE